MNPLPAIPDEIPSRKKEHVELCLASDVSFKKKSNGFDEWEFEHNALPELDLSEIDTTTHFLGKKLAIPLLVSGMTGGYSEASRINASLAKVCQLFGIGLGVGSQRQALENDAFHESYAIVRKHAPSIPVIGNIGATEIANLRDVDPIRRLVDLIEADAFAVHLNPLQEFLQPEGNTNFRGVLTGISTLVQKLPVPVIVKEVGAGISPSVAKRLFDVGVTIIDVAGAGGTSWAGVELLRNEHASTIAPEFWDWGVPTAIAVRQVSACKPCDATLIASGGIANGVMIAKALALGADLTSMARPLLQILMEGGEDSLFHKLTTLKNDLLGVMFLTGASSIPALKATPIQRHHY